MKNNFVKKLAFLLALTLSVGATPSTMANASSVYPDFYTKKAIVKEGETKKYATYDNSAWSFYKVTSAEEDIATSKVSRKGKCIKITGVKAGKTQVHAYFKNYKTKEEYTNSLNVTVKKDVVKEAATNYFANYVDRKRQVADVFKLIDEKADIVIIDIRSAEDYAKEHLKGAINIPYAKIAENLTIIPDDVPVYVNCYSGQTASQTIALLAVAGKDAYNIQGGWNNGISQAEGYENYVDTVAVPLPTKQYSVDKDIKEAIKKYYADAATSASGNFNFPVADLAKLVENGDDTYTIVDIRSAEDYAKGHIESAKINVPFPSAMPEGFANIPTDKPVIVHCYSGQTASQTVAILRLLGYEAYNLSGGMNNGWLKNELPVVPSATE